MQDIENRDVQRLYNSGRFYMVAKHACPTLVSLEVLQAYVSIVGCDRATPMHQTKVTAGQVWLCSLNGYTLLVQ